MKTSEGVWLTWTVRLPWLACPWTFRARSCFRLRCMVTLIDSLFLRFEARLVFVFVGLFLSVRVILEDSHILRIQRLVVVTFSISVLMINVTLTRFYDAI
jgi:hypothetical protein